MTRMRVDFNSPYYPYEKVTPGANTYKGIEDIPRKIIMYLLDLPDKYGYNPQDDNSRPRVRLAKYLWYDGVNPLGEKLPTTEEKLSMLFDPEHPVIDRNELKEAHPKGYRIYPQEYWGQSQTDAQITLKIYMARTRPNSFTRAELGVYFEIMANSNLETNPRASAYSRCYAIEQAILEALNGVNMAGVGMFNFHVYADADNGSRPVVDDGTNVGRLLHLSITWMDNGTLEDNVVNP